MRILKRILIWVAILTAAAAVILFSGALLIQTYLSKWLEDYVRNELGWTLKIRSAQITFRPLSLRLDQIELAADQKPFFEARSAFAELPYSSFWADQFRVHRINIDAPKVDLDVLHTLKAKSRESSETKRFSIDRVIIRNGEVHFQKRNLKKINIESAIDSDGIRFLKLGSSYETITINTNGSLKNWSKPRLDFDYSIEGESAALASLVERPAEWKGQVITHGSLKGEWQHLIASGHLESSNFVVRNSDPFSFSGNYQYDLANQLEPITASITMAEVPLDLIHKFSREVPSSSSVADGTIEYSGNTDFWNGKGKFAILLKRGKRQQLPVSGQIYGHLDGGSIVIEQSNLKLMNSQLNVNGAVFKNQLAVNAILQTSNLNDLAFLSSQLAGIRGAYKMQAQVSGAYKDLQVRATINGSSGNSVIEAKGSASLGTQSVSIEFQGAAQASELRRYIADLHDGNVRFQGTVGGTFHQPQVNASIQGDNLEIAGITLNEFSAEIQTNGKTIQFEVAAPEFPFQADGTYQIARGMYEIHGKADGVSLEKIAAQAKKEQVPVQGTVSLTFDASGNIRRWKDSVATIHIQAPEIQWKDLIVHIPESEIRVEKRIAHVNARAESQNARLQVNGTASLQTGIPLDLQVNGNMNGAVLEKLSRDWKGNGELNFNATVHGPSANPIIEGDLSTQNFLANYLPKGWNITIQQMTAKVVERRLSVEGDGKFNDSPFQLKGVIPLKTEGGNLHLELSDLPIRTFVADESVSGGVSLMADLQGQGFPLREWMEEKTEALPFENWSGEISISPTNVQYRNSAINVDHPLHLTIQNHLLSLSRTQISSGELLDFVGSGTLNLQTGEFDTEAHLESKLELLASLREDIQSSGPLVAELKLKGTAQHPQYSGTIQLANASLRVPDSPITLEGLDLVATVDNQSLRIEKLQGRSGGGVITGGGELVFGSKSSEVWLQGKNVAANYPEGLRSQMDFNLKLAAIEDGAILSGNISVLRSIYRDELTLRNPIIRRLLAATNELAAQKAFRNRIKLDLTIKTVQDLNLKNNIAVARAGGNLKLTGTLYRPGLTGQIDVRPGSRLFLLGNEYDVEKARIDFFGSDVIEPNLDVTISTLLRDFQTDNYYEVYLPFGGPLSNIEFKNVRSSPSLSQEQIFNLLAQGTTQADTSSASSRSVFQRQLLTFVAGQAFAAPGARIAKTIGLSRIQVQQEGLSSVNDPQTRLMLGKDIGAGFNLIYSFVLNDPQEQTWIATYRYGRNIIGRFIDQDNGTYTVSASHRIPFGPGENPQFASGFRKKTHGLRIESIEWTNDSPLTEKQIQGLLNTETGDDYEYWAFQDRVDDLKKELQKLGYLFPVVDVRENETQKGIVALKIEVHSGDRSEMIFRGYEVKGKLYDRYKQMWRSAFSALVVQQMIQDDLLLQMQLSGYYKSSVSSRVEKTNEKTTYDFDITPGPKFTSIELDFRGTEHYQPQALQADLQQLYPSSAMLFREAIRKPNDFSEKIKALYIQKGYLRTNIQFENTQFADSGKIVQTIHVQEGSLSSIQTVGIANGKTIPDELQTQIALTEGKVFTPDGLLGDEITIKDFYETQGYQNIAVQYNIQFANGTTDLKLLWIVKSGPIARVASVRVEGNQSTRTDFILRRAGLKPGDVLSQHNQSFARKRLSDLGVFQEIELENQPTDVPGNYDVVIHVTESKRYEFQYGGRYNTEDGFGAELRLADFNFLGKAHNVSMYVRTTYALPLFRFDYILPVTGSFWDRSRFSFFRDETDDDVRATVSGDLFKYFYTKKELTLQFQQEHWLGNQYRILWGFHFGRLSNDFDDHSVFPPGFFEGNQAVFRGTFLTDRRDDPLNATRGYFYSIDGEYAPNLGTDIIYKKNFDQFFYYLPLGKLVLASGVRAGFLWVGTTNDIINWEKFRTGGSTTLRGFEHNTVVPLGDPNDLENTFFGGDSVLILNEEFRFPIYKWFSAATFFDAGNVYKTVSDFDPTSLRYSAGFGFRAGAAGFIVRFDWGFNIDRRENEPPHVFHFGIGQAF